VGDTVIFRWDFGQDGCGGNLGWFVDDVKLLACPLPPELSVGAGYEDPDTDGNFELTWVRPDGATGPDALQESSLCTPAFTDDAEEPLVFGANALWEGSPQWTSSTSPNDGSTTYYVPDGSLQDDALTLVTPIAIPAGASSTLRFTTSYGLESGYDYGYVEVSTDGGTTWTAVASYNGPAGLGATPVDYVDSSETIDLSSYAGQSILIQFRITSDNYNEGAPAGWYIDNISVVNSLWSDAAAPTGASHVVTGKADGTYCYRVKTRIPAEGALLDSPFSNIVDVTVAIEPPVNLAPVANAGADLPRNEGAAVSLDGTLSHDPEGAPLSFAWTQTAGPPVTLAGADTATPSFSAPQVVADTPLRFQLTVSDGALSASDEMEVLVQDVPGGGGGTTPPPSTPAAPTIGNTRVGGLPPVTLLVLGLLVLRRRLPRR
jgi:hypothetical protein